MEFTRRGFLGLFAATGLSKYLPVPDSKYKLLPKEIITESPCKLPAQIGVSINGIGMSGGIVAFSMGYTHSPIEIIEITTGTYQYISGFTEVNINIILIDAAYASLIELKQRGMVHRIELIRGTEIVTIDAVCNSIKNRAPFGGPMEWNISFTGNTRA
jgi:hypothetical protein